MRTVMTLAAGFILAGCASGLSGNDQYVHIDTPGVDGARCTTQDSLNAFRHLDWSPGKVAVPKGDGPMTISCSKSGFETTSVSVDEEFNNYALWNFTNGFVPGTYIDWGTGAIQRYPETVTVWLRPVRFPSKAAENAWNAAKKEHEDKMKAAE